MSRSNLRTSSSKNKQEQFLNADVFSYKGTGGGRGGSQGRNLGQAA